MLKKIAVTDLKVGMYLHEMCGSWMDHPFWRTSFVVESADDIRRLRESSISEVWIDVSRGLDIDKPAVVREEADVQVEQDLLRAATEPKTVVERVTRAQEITRAARICAQAREAVISMFHEARMGKAIEARDVEPLVDEISASVARNPGALISLARLKTSDDYTYMHSVAVCALMIALARQLGLDEAQTREAGFAGLLHDLGKMAIPTAVLNKPGKLTDAEFALIKNHPQAGHRMLLASSGASPITLDVCLHHHEKIDGSGYPSGLADAEISLFAKMGAVCDVYDAITSNRCYKTGWDPAESLRRMAEWSKGHFDETVFQAFVKSVGIYPIGALVRLESQHLAVVVEQSERSLLTPHVKVFFSIRSGTRIAPRVLDLSRPGCSDRIVARESPDKWRLAGLEALWATS